MDFVPIQTKMRKEPHLGCKMPWKIGVRLRFFDGSEDKWA